MIRLFALILSLIILSSPSFAGKNKRTWDYPLMFYKNYMAQGSDNFRQLNSNLRKDKSVSREFENNEETGLIGYLLFENGAIVIDESDIPFKVQGDRIIKGLLPSASMGKSLVSYVTGHAICEGYISDINEKISGWDVVSNTLFEDIPLIDLLNMQAGDDKYAGERLRPKVDNMLKGHENINVNTIPLNELMKTYLQGSKRAIPSFNAKKPKYNYSALTTNVLMNYVIHKSGDNWEQLLSKVFTEHVSVKDPVYFHQTVKQSDRRKGSGRYSFYASRHDYLRIGHAMLEDWHSDTCIGDYLRTIYKQRITKSDGEKTPVQAGLYSKSYGGQFHFDLFGISDQIIFGVSGFAGQEMIIDMGNKRIIVVNSLYRNYDWETIVYDQIKQ